MHYGIMYSTVSYELARQLKQLLLLPADTPFEIEIPDIGNMVIEPESITANAVYETAQTIMPACLSISVP